MTSSEPTVTCQLCGRSEVVKPDGRGFPPDIAKRKLRKRCCAWGCTSDPQYRAGVSIRMTEHDTG
jgi:hypothetical protein